jgi:hypothetical protein
MTTPDDPTIALLERDLAQLARPTETDKAFRLALRSQLAQQLTQPPQLRHQPGRIRRNSRLRLAFGAGSIACLAAVAAIAFLGTSGAGGSSAADAAILRQARAAVTPPANMILHVKMVSQLGSSQVVGEWWQQTSAPYAGRWIKGTPGHQDEAADNGTTSFSYDAASNTIYQRPDTAPPRFSDPLSQIRNELASGNARVLGTTTINGAPLYKIALPNNLVGYFDTTSYKPLYLDDPQRNGGTVRFSISDLEYLPTTADPNALSLSAQHPTARIDSNPNDWPGAK